MRPRLDELLRRAHDSAPPTRVIGVSGAAGAGKTTLLSVWARRLLAEGIEVAWLALGPGHDDPAEATEALASALDLATRAEEVWLFLDDVHRLRSRRARRQVQQLVLSSPTHVKIALGGRADPLASLGLDRLRLAGEVLEVRDGDLRFSLAEAGELVREHGLTLGTRDLEELLRLTEGWAAGLRLASLALVGGQPVEELLRSFATEDASLASYLTTEVVGQLDRPTALFLRATSLVRELSVPLAEELSGRTDTEALMGKLAREHPLVTRVAGPGSWYRYHPLLRAHLAAELQRDDPARFFTLQGRASRWLEANGLVHEALPHAVASHDTAHLRLVLSEHGIGIVLEGRQTTLVEALREAPQTTLTDPVIGSIMAFAHARDGDLDRADALLAHLTPAAAAAPGPDEKLAVRLARLARLDVDRLRGVVAVTPVLEHVLEDVAAHERAEASARLRSKAERDLELAELVVVGTHLAEAARLEKAHGVLAEALRLAERLNRSLVVVECMVTLSRVAARLGDFAAMTKWAHGSIAVAAEHGWSASPQLAFAYTLAAATAYETYDLQTASDLSKQALAAIGSGVTDTAVQTRGTDEVTARSAETLAFYLEFDRAQAPQRRELLATRRNAMERLARHPYPDALVAYETREFERMALLVGELDITEWVIGLTDQLLQGRAEPVVMLAALHAHLGEHRQALSLLGPVTSGQLPVVVVTTTITAWLVSAAVAARTGRPASAHEAVAAAVRLAGPRNTVRLMVEVAPEIPDLLRSGRQRFGRHEPFVERVLRASQDLRDGRRETSDPGPVLSSSLTLVELSLLRDLSSLLSVAELAAARQVTPNTVKTQVRSIFTKLQVHTRRDAVEAGHRLGII